MHITIKSSIANSPRVAQVRGMFDLPERDDEDLSWSVDFDLAERPWQIGLITGPSGCGKSTVALHLWPDNVVTQNAFPWPVQASVLDGFPETMAIKDIVSWLSAVGFSSPPAWLRPFANLSTGQQFRVTLARALAEATPGRPVVFDEFTSVVDRTVACIGSTAVGKLVRANGLQFVAVTCHDDVTEWLQPNWIYYPSENRHEWRRLRRRPEIPIEIVRCAPSAWSLFANHHYLNHRLAPGAICFLALWQDQPVAFSAWLNHMGKGPRSKREHRTVTLPDYQGVGIGNALSAFVASLWQGLGFRAISTTTHPGMIASRRRSPLWQMHRPPSIGGHAERGIRHATTRLTASFTYVGPSLANHLAVRLLESDHAHRPTTAHGKTHSRHLPARSRGLPRPRRR